MEERRGAMKYPLERSAVRTLAVNRLTSVFSLSATCYTRNALGEDSTVRGLPTKRWSRRL